MTLIQLNKWLNISNFKVAKKLKIVSVKSGRYFLHIDIFFFSLSFTIPKILVLIEELNLEAFSF